ncbi:MAG TPA: pantoate--beta-alanine ligase [Pilimelia sp.]|nr:pantoate--beta-alanine ligase [Pilimelia sp.]
MTRVVHRRAELRAARDAMPGAVAVVMTMGALHEGHARLLRAARAQADHVIATVFVNPLQFGPAEDFDRYPRTRDADVAVCAREGVDLVFAPGAAEMYPAGRPATAVTAGAPGEALEGRSRPGFFTGVLTVVLKLLHLTRPHRALFGEKDYQQLTVIRAMVRDLDLPVQVVGVPTVREPDGLALSSRNRYLDPAERVHALRLFAALRAGEAAAATGAGGPAVLDAARAVLAGDAAVAVDYCALTDPDLGPPPQSGPARLLVAARVGTTRLIDNAPIDLAPHL